MKRIPKGAFLSACCEEPFRIFFPLGILAGLMGVSLWPLHFSGIHKFYPGIMHARLMVEGFMTAFVIGFLGTAGPRLTSTPHFSLTELKLLLSLYVATSIAHIAEQSMLGDVFFLLLLVCFVSLLITRFARSDESPPPGFVLVGIGFITAIAGTCLVLIGWMGNSMCAVLGGLLLNQAFVLFLVLGVGSFLLPRFLSLQGCPQRTAGVSWIRQAARAGLVAVVILAAFVAEGLGTSPRLAALTRFAAAAAYLFSQVPLHRAIKPRVTLVQSLRLSLALLILGLLCQVIWPTQRLAALHVVFIGGFSMITLTVATRVILGHAGLGQLFHTRLSAVLAMMSLLLPSMALRFVGDFLPPIRGGMLSGASYFWIAGAAVWACLIVPKVLVADDEN